MAAPRYAARKSTELKVKPRPGPSYRILDDILELINEEVKSDALKVARCDGAENVRKHLDDQSAEFQFLEGIQAR
jgi:hypothetical protein